MSYLLALLVLGALEVSAAQGCPDAGAITERHAALVGRATPVPSAWVRFEQLQGGYRVTVSLEGSPRPPRALESASCAELADAVALMLSLEGDTTPVLVASPPAPSRPKPSTLGWLAVVGGARLGLVPSPSARVRLEVGVEAKALRASVGVSTGSGQTLVGTPIEGAGVTLSVPVAVELGACGLKRLERVAFGVCAGAELGALSASGFGLSQSANGVAAWLTVSGGLRASIALTQALALRAEVFAGANLIRPRIVVQPRPEVYQVPVFTGGALVGLEVRMW